MAENLEVGMKLHAKYWDGEYYPAIVDAVSTSKSRSKAPVKVSFVGYDESTWKSVADLKSKKLPKTKEPAAKAKAKVKAKAKAKAKTKKPYPDGAVTYIYWPLQAKGLAGALALEYSGLEYKFEFPSDEPDKMFAAFTEKYKLTTPFGHLPILKIPGLPDIGQEIAILNVIAKIRPKMAGRTTLEVAMVQQLLQESEDIYQKLVKKHPTVIQKEKDSKEDLDTLWTDTDRSKHSASSGVKVHLGNLETMLGKSGFKNKFTAAGFSVGELKLWSMLHQMKHVEGDILNEFEGLKTFYEELAEKDKTKKILNGEGMGSALGPYFVPYK